MATFYSYGYGDIVPSLTVAPHLLMSVAAPGRPTLFLVDEYVLAAGIRDDGKGPLFRSAIGKTGVLTATPMNRVDAYRMVRRRAAEAGFKVKLGCHVFRATGITAYLEAGGTLENAQAMAAHESPRTTKLYDRTSDAITLVEIERITI
jgi:integrase